MLVGGHRYRGCFAQQLSNVYLNCPSEVCFLDFGRLSAVASKADSLSSFDLFCIQPFLMNLISIDRTQITMLNTENRSELNSVSAN